MTKLERLLHCHRNYGYEITYADLLKVKEEVENRQPQLEPVQQDRVAELEAANSELLDALKGVTDELLDVLHDINNDRIPFDGDEFHDRLEAGKAAIKKHGGA